MLKEEGSSPALTVGEKTSKGGVQGSRKEKENPGDNEKTSRSAKNAERGSQQQH